MAAAKALLIAAGFLKQNKKLVKKSSATERSTSSSSTATEHSRLPLTGLPMSTSKLQAAASENRFLLGDNDLLWMAQDFQPNIHIDDIHYDLSWPRQQQGDL